MNNRYKNAISKIKTTDEFKSQLIKNMKLEQEKQNAKNSFSFKIKKIISTITGILGVALCSGLVYAAVTGSIKFGDQNIEFSENLEEYTETVQNQYLEKDGNKIELTSKAVDDGFVILQFDVTLSDEQTKIAEESCGLEYVSFNDIDMEEGFPRLAGANYNVIIDGEKTWLRGASANDIIENVPNKNYTFYQLWFLSDNEIGNKEEFTLTLDDVKIVSSEIVIEFDGKFDIELSKTKILEDTIKYQPENAEIQYKRLTNSIDTIIETPLQTLIKMETVLEDVTNKNYASLDNDDYIGDLHFKVYDQDNNELSEYDLITNYQYYFENGNIEQREGDDFKLYNGFNKYDYKSYIAIAQNENVTEITVQVLEYNDYTATTRKIGEYEINLKNGKVKSENKDEIVEEAENAYSDLSTDTIDVSDIREFSIDLKTDDYRIDRVVDYEYPEENSGVIQAITEENNEGSEEVVTYEIDLKDSGAYFQLVVFVNKEKYSSYEYISGDIEPIKIAENDDYIVVLNAFTDYNYDLIKDIIKTIKLK